MLANASEAFTDWRLDDEVAERVILALHESPVYGEPFYWGGHSSVAAARILLHFGSQCHGCNQRIDLSEPDARDQILVHTTDPLPRPDPGSPIERWTAHRLGVRTGPGCVRPPAIGLPFCVARATAECETVVSRQWSTSNSPCTRRSIVKESGPRGSDTECRQTRELAALAHHGRLLPER